MAKKPRKKKLVPQSLNEFRAWLSGVEEMQEADWLPNDAQWDLIRQRIGLIEHTQPVSVNHSPANTSKVIVPNTEFQVPSSGTAFDDVEIIRPPVGSTLRAPQPTSVDNQGKTPDIDSTSGYTSKFT